MVLESCQQPLVLNIAYTSSSSSCRTFPLTNYTTRQQMCLTDRVQFSILLPTSVELFRSGKLCERNCLHLEKNRIMTNRTKLCPISQSIQNRFSNKYFYAFIYFQLQRFPLLDQPSVNILL